MNLIRGLVPKLRLGTQLRQTLACRLVLMRCWPRRRETRRSLRVCPRSGINITPVGIGNSICNHCYSLEAYLTNFRKDVSSQHALSVGQGVPPKFMDEKTYSGFLALMTGGEHSSEAALQVVDGPSLIYADVLIGCHFWAWFNSASHWVAEPRPLGSGVLAILQWIPLPDGRGSATSL